MISAIVLTYNEERHLPACLASLQWADEIVVLDSGSHDQTVSIAQAAQARVVHHPFTHFGEQREVALRLASHAWVFFVDADERVPPALAEEVQQVVKMKPIHHPNRPPLGGGCLVATSFGAKKFATVAGHLIISCVFCVSKPLIMI